MSANPEVLPFPSAWAKTYKAARLLRRHRRAARAVGYRLARAAHARSISESETHRKRYELYVRVFRKVETEVWEWLRQEVGVTP